MITQGSDFEAYIQENIMAKNVKQADESKMTEEPNQAAQGPEVPAVAAAPAAIAHAPGLPVQAPAVALPQVQQATAAKQPEEKKGEKPKGGKVPKKAKTSAKADASTNSSNKRKASGEASVEENGQAADAAATATQEELVEFLKNALNRANAAKE